MIHDQDLADRLGALDTESFDDVVFRATRINADPTAPSINGGRWAYAADTSSATSVLYTSLTRDGAVAEVVSFLAALTPPPGPRPIKVTRLAVSTSRTLRLTRAQLEALGVDFGRYGERDYTRTQEIGSVLAILGFDGLIAPSARWPCDNLMVFIDNHALTHRLDVLESDQLEWRAWARTHGFLP
jgi:hypothetical protein